MAADATPVMEIRLLGATVPEALTLLAVLREHVSMEIVRAGARESFLFVRGVFVGPSGALARLRVQLVDPTPAEVTLTSHDRLTGLYGQPVTVTELVLDPEGKLRT